MKTWLFCTIIMLVGTVMGLIEALERIGDLYEITNVHAGAINSCTTAINEQAGIINLANTEFRAAINQHADALDDHAMHLNDNGRVIDEIVDYLNK